jgi:hypothetical protein
MPDILIPDSHVLSSAQLDHSGARYQRTLRTYSRALREDSRDLVARSREQRVECRRLAAQSDRAQAIPHPVVA